jgi:hypothetical protein
VLRSLLEVLGQAPHDQGYLDLQEAFIDWSFAPRKQGGARVGLRWIIRSPSFVQWALHAQTAPIQHMRVYHRRAHVAMAQQVLDRPDVLARLQQMRRERMAKRVRPRADTQSAATDATSTARRSTVSCRWCRRSSPVARSRYVRVAETPIARPAPTGARILRRQRVRNPDTASAARQIFIVLPLHSCRRFPEWFTQPGGQRRHAILPSLPIPDPDLATTTRRISASAFARGSVRVLRRSRGRGRTCGRILRRP